MANSKGETVFLGEEVSQFLTGQQADSVTCDQCGEIEDVQCCDYDAMVDGPGFMMSENLCRECRKPKI